MYRILSASKDTYITNKISDNTFRVTDANVGQAGTLDLFKLYGESKLSGSSASDHIELSRLLIKFDLNEVADMQSSGLIDIDDVTFKCFLKLHDVYGGQTTPSNFNVCVFPLSKSFDEGSGYDITTFRDIDTCNFITSSFSNGTNLLWNTPGAMKSGSLDDENIDIIVSGTFPGYNNSNPTSLTAIQRFKTGEENLFVDVTRFVSGVVANHIDNHGFLISYSGSFENDSNSYFVKRFASRNAVNTAIRPKIIVKYDDSLHDYHEDFIFNVTSSLYLNNFHYGASNNILSGLGATELTGRNCMILKIETGSFKRTFNVSQALVGQTRLTGIYSASFAINSFETALYSHVQASGSIVFNEIWSNSSETITYQSSSLTISANQRNAFENFHQNLLVTVINLRESYKIGDKIKVRVFAENRDRDIVFSKLPIEKKSQIYHEMYYRVRDIRTGDLIIPFDTDDKSTRLSTDSSGMYFTFFIDSLPKGRIYTFDFLIKKNGFDTIITDAASKFRVD